MQEQVTQMDLIYSCAHLTIIAAAGEAPNYGLPGVGGRSRQPQPHGIIRGHMLVSTLPDPRIAVANSKWFQRGWTYQEGLLSPRRLIFTDHQVYFKCSGMYCCEALDFPLRSLHNKHGQRFKSKFCDNINIGMFPKGFGTSAWDVVKRIEDYSERKLTDPADVLNGISGVLQAFRRGKKRVLHCSGVPMILAAPQQRRKKMVCQESGPKLQEWSPLAGFCGGLCWGVSSPSERREGFPPSSWTGWRGKISWGIPEHQWHSLAPNKNLQFSIQLDDGQFVDLETFCHSDMSMKTSNTLQVATWIFPLRTWKTRAFGRRLEYEAILEPEDKGPSIWNFEPACAESLPTDTRCFGIPLYHTPEGQPFQIMYVLVIRAVKSGVYERVGFGEMDGNIETVSEYEKGEFKGLLLWLPLPSPKKVWKEFQLC